MLLVADIGNTNVVLGIYDENKEVVLLEPKKPVSNGLKIG